MICKIIKRKKCRKCPGNSSSSSGVSLPLFPKLLDVTFTCHWCTDTTLLERTKQPRGLVHRGPRKGGGSTPTELGKQHEPASKLHYRNISLDGTAAEHARIC